jgi:hypothetical protein
MPQQGETRSYVVTVHLTVDEQAHELVQTIDGLRDEVASWLCDLDCAVGVVCVERVDTRGKVCERVWSDYADTIETAIEKETEKARVILAQHGLSFPAGT